MIRKYEDDYYDLRTGLKVEDFSQLQYDKEYGIIVKEVDEDMKVVDWHWVGQDVTKIEDFEIVTDLENPVKIGDTFYIGKFKLRVIGFDMWRVIAVRISNNYTEKLRMWHDLLQYKLKIIKKKIEWTKEIWLK